MCTTRISMSVQIKTERNLNPFLYRGQIHTTGLINALLDKVLSAENQIEFYRINLLGQTEAFFSSNSLLNSEILQLVKKKKNLRRRINCCAEEKLNVTSIRRSFPKKIWRLGILYMDSQKLDYRKNSDILLRVQIYMFHMFPSKYICIYKPFLRHRLQILS